MMIGLMVFVAHYRHGGDPDRYIKSKLGTQCCVKDANGSKHTHTIQDMLSLKSRALATYARTIRSPIQDSIAGRMDERVLAASEVLARCVDAMSREDAGMTRNLSAHIAAFSGGLYNFVR